MLVSGLNRLPSSPSNPCGLANGIPSENGLRCVGGDFLRYGGRPVASDGSVGLTTNGFGTSSGPFGGLAQFGGHTAGEVRHFQFWVRDIQACVANSGWSNAVTVTFTP